MTTEVCTAPHYEVDLGGAHHEYGPSKLENYDPRSGGCSMFVPNPDSNRKAADGTLKHQAGAAGNLEILGGDAQAEAEVRRVLEFVKKTLDQEYHHLSNEVTLRTDKIFGTLDYLGINWNYTKAAIVDSKYGEWPVAHAKRNLQGWGYALLVFHNYPTVNRIKVSFYAAKYDTFTEAVFYRRKLPVLEKRIYAIIEKAIKAKENPSPKDYTPDAVNCSFCVRVNCPARLALMGTLVNRWTEQPLELPRLDLLQVTTPQLATLKRLSNVFRRFSDAVDMEAKRRAFDAGDIVPGYEISEKSGTRTVVGAENITAASSVLAESWDSLFNSSQNWGDYILANTELPISDLEKEIARRAPYGKGTLAKKNIVAALEKAGLIQANKIFYLSAIKG